MTDMAVTTNFSMPAVGRRPVFDRSLHTVAYELVSPNAHRRPGDDKMLLQALASGSFGDLLRGTRPLVRVSGDYLSAGHLATLAIAEAIVDVHAMDVDDSAIEQLQGLRERGVTIVLTEPGPFTPSTVLDLADMVRLDVRASSLVIERLPGLRARGVELIADNVENHRELDRWRDQGFSWFQGWFLTEPEAHQTGIPHDRLSLLRLLATVDDPDRDLDDIERAVEAQPALSYRLLRYVNSAYVGLRHRMDSIRQAVMTVGPTAMRDLIAVTMLEAVSGKPRELLRTLLIRAKLSEYLAPRLDVPPATAFMAGLFSGMDAVVDRPKEEILEGLPLSDEVVGAVLRLEGEIGAVVALAIAYEQCDWSHALFRAQDIGELAEIYLRAVGWVESAMPSHGDALG